MKKGFSHPFLFPIGVTLEFNVDVFIHLQDFIQSSHDLGFTHFFGDILYNSCNLNVFVYLICYI